MWVIGFNAKNPVTEIPKQLSKGIVSRLFYLITKSQ